MRAVIFSVLRWGPFLAGLWWTHLHHPWHAAPALAVVALLLPRHYAVGTAGAVAAAFVPGIPPVPLAVAAVYRLLYEKPLLHCVVPAARLLGISPRLRCRHGRRAEVRRADAALRSGRPGAALDGYLAALAAHGRSDGCVRPLLARAAEAALRCGCPRLAAELAAGAAVSGPGQPLGRTAVRVARAHAVRARALRELGDTEAAGAAVRAAQRSRHGDRGTEECVRTAAAEIHFHTRRFGGDYDAEVEAAAEIVRQQRLRAGAKRAMITMFTAMGHRLRDAGDPCRAASVFGQAAAETGVHDHAVRTSVNVFTWWRIRLGPRWRGAVRLWLEALAHQMRCGIEAEHEPDAESRLVHEWAVNLVGVFDDPLLEARLRVYRHRLEGRGEEARGEHEAQGEHRAPGKRAERAVPGEGVSGVPSGFRPETRPFVFADPTAQRSWARLREVAHAGAAEAETPARGGLAGRGRTQEPDRDVASDPGADSPPAWWEGWCSPATAAAGAREALDLFTRLAAVAPEVFDPIRKRVTGPVSVPGARNGSVSAPPATGTGGGPAAPTAAVLHRAPDSPDGPNPQGDPDVRPTGQGNSGTITVPERASAPGRYVGPSGPGEREGTRNPADADGPPSARRSPETAGTAPPAPAGTATASTPRRAGTGAAEPTGPDRATSTAGPAPSATDPAPGLGTAPATPGAGGRAPSGGAGPHDGADGSKETAAWRIVLPAEPPEWLREADTLTAVRCWPLMSAFAEAYAMGHARVTAGHLLLVLLDDPECVLAAEAGGLERARLRRALGTLYGPGGAGLPELADETRTVLRRARKTADRHGERDLTPMRLMNAVLAREQTVVAALFGALGADVDEVRVRVRHQLDRVGAETAGTEPLPPWIRWSGEQPVRLTPAARRVLARAAAVAVSTTGLLGPDQLRDGLRDVPRARPRAATGGKATGGGAQGPSPESLGNTLCRLTPRARRVLADAGAAARAQGHPGLGVEHLKAALDHVLTAGTRGDGDRAAAGGADTRPGPGGRTDADRASVTGTDVARAGVARADVDPGPGSPTAAVRASRGRTEPDPGPGGRTRTRPAVAPGTPPEDLPADPWRRPGPADPSVLALTTRASAIAQASASPCVGPEHLAAALESAAPASVPLHAPHPRQPLPLTPLCARVLAAAGESAAGAGRSSWDADDVARALPALWQAPAEPDPENPGEPKSPHPYRTGALTALIEAHDWTRAVNAEAQRNITALASGRPGPVREAHVRWTAVLSFLARLDPGSMAPMAVGELLTAAQFLGPGPAAARLLRDAEAGARAFAPRHPDGQARLARSLSDIAACGLRLGLTGEAVRCYERAVRALRAPEPLWLEDRGLDELLGLALLHRAEFLAPQEPAAYLEAAGHYLGAAADGDADRRRAAVWACGRVIGRLRTLGEKTAALDVATRTLRLFDEPVPELGDVHQERADLLYALGREDVGLGDVAAAARLAPERPYPALRQGVFLERVGRLDEAVAAYRRSAVLDPAYTGTRSRLGQALVRQGHHEEALSLLADEWRSPSLLARAQALRALGRTEEAWADLRAASAAAPGIAWYRYHHGLGLLEAGDERRGRLQIGEAIRLEIADLGADPVWYAVGAGNVAVYCAALGGLRPARTWYAAALAAMRLPWSADELHHDLRELVAIRPELASLVDDVVRGLGHRAAPGAGAVGSPVGTGARGTDAGDGSGASTGRRPGEP